MKLIWLGYLVYSLGNYAMKLCIELATTGFWYFAESPSARQRARKLSAKPLPSARSTKTARQRQSLPSATSQALGKGFVDSHVSTRQRLTAISQETLLDGSLPRATMVESRHRFFFEKFFAERLFWLALGKDYLFVF